MKELLQATIEQLRFHVMKNLELVRENEHQIREMLKMPVSEDRAFVLSDKYDFSKKKLAENNDFINLQLSIINFVHKYKGVWDKKNEMACVREPGLPYLTRQECFQLTIDAKMEYGPDHPFYDDDSFFYHLLEFYKSREDYEKCDEIVKKRF